MKTLTFCFLFLLFITSLSTSQPQQYWGEQSSGVTVQLTSVSAVNHQAVWVCGYSGTVLRTTNSGLNWLNVSGGGIPNTVSLVNVWGISASSALVAGYQGTNTWVWKTTNSGANWVQVFAQPGGFINGIIMKNAFPNQGIMQGDPVGGRWSLWKTTNAGTNWDSTGMYLPQSGAEAGWNNSICMSGFWTSDTSIWFGTNNYRVYHSSNGGQSWVAQSTSPEQNSYAIDYLGNIWGGGLTGGDSLMRTTNLGYNWTRISSLGSGNFGGFVVFGMTVDNFGYCWYVRGDNKIYRGSGGYNWQVEFTAPAGNYRHMSRARGFGTYIWAVRTNGGITRCTCYIAAITKISNSVPDQYSLKQNFPNPFNPQTSIEFDLPRKSKVKLNVYDLSGRLVTSFIDYELLTGSYRVSWDASGLASGVYFYSLITDEYVQTKKMILMK